jgi:hypothetical protein
VPKLNELHEKYAKDGLVLIGVHSDPDTAKGKESVKTDGMKYVVSFDGGKLMKAFKCDSFPDYVIIDHKGIVRAVDLANAEAEKAIKMLLEEKKKDGK